MMPRWDSGRPQTFWKRPECRRGVSSGLENSLSLVQAASANLHSATALVGVALANRLPVTSLTADLGPSPANLFRKQEAAEAALERRDSEFEAKMAQNPVRLHTLCVFTYKEVEILKEAGTAAAPSDAGAIVSYDEKPGVQAIGATAPDLLAETRPSCGLRP